MSTRPLAIDVGRTAVILIDLMPRIIELRTAPHTGWDVLTRSLRLADACRAGGGTIAFVRVESSGVDEQPPGSGLAEECLVQPGDLEIVKRTVGAFHNTGLDAALRDRGVDTVILAGLVTNFGVEMTGRSADEHGYQVIFVEDATSALHARAHKFATRYVFPRVGIVSRTDDVVAALCVSVGRTS